MMVSDVGNGIEDTLKVGGGGWELERVIDCGCGGGSIQSGEKVNEVVWGGGGGGSGDRIIVMVLQHGSMIVDNKG